jgi:hypothetical protein
MHRQWRKALVAALGAVLISCNLDLSEEQPTIPPHLPGAESVQLDLSLFHTAVPGSLGPTRNWAIALENVAVLDTSIAEMLAIPGAALRAVAGTSPTRFGTGWKWPFTGTLRGIPYTGFLAGGVYGVGYGWEMVVNAPGFSPPVVNRRLMFGIANFFASSGTWAVYNLDTDPTVDSATVDWGGTVYDYELRGVRLTSERADPMQTVNYFPVDAGAAAFQLTWNTQTGEGRIGDGCWDSRQNDKPCH